MITHRNVDGRAVDTANESCRVRDRTLRVRPGHSELPPTCCQVDLQKGLVYCPVLAFNCFNNRIYSQTRTLDAESLRSRHVSWTDTLSGRSNHPLRVAQPTQNHSVSTHRRMTHIDLSVTLFQCSNYTFCFWTTCVRLISGANFRLTAILTISVLEPEDYRT